MKLLLDVALVRSFTIMFLKIWLKFSYVYLGKTNKYIYFRNTYDDIILPNPPSEIEFSN